ncbi:MAG: hypothetical protein Q8R02_12390, partial [Hyphomonadaceae bacterium]|nr:hypothetical protein [Hyphomonadaceae bacterium]
PMERPKDIKELVLTDEQARDLGAKWSKETPDLIDPDFFLQNISQLASVKGTMRSSLLVKPEDGQMPFTEKGVKLAERAFEREDFAFDNPEERPTYERCIAGQGQAPIRQIPAFIPNLIVQTPASIALITEDVGSLRIIHMDGRKPPPDVIRTYEGWSAGHWDGDTLVVVTTHTRADDLVRGQFGRPVLVGPGSKVIERFTRLSADELHYEFTVEDPDLYTAPWIAEYVFKLADTPWYEYACHEANYSMTNALLAARLGRQSKPKPKK